MAIKFGKFMSAALAGAVASFDYRRRLFAGSSVRGTWPYSPRVSQKKRRLNARRCA